MREWIFDEEVTSKVRFHMMDTEVGLFVPYYTEPKCAKAITTPWPNFYCRQQFTEIKSLSACSTHLYMELDSSCKYCLYRRFNFHWLSHVINGDLDVPSFDGEFILMYSRSLWGRTFFCFSFHWAKDSNKREKKRILTLTARREAPSTNAAIKAVSHTTKMLRFMNLKCSVHQSCDTIASATLWSHVSVSWPIHPFYGFAAGVSGSVTPRHSHFSKLAWATLFENVCLNGFGRPFGRLKSGINRYITLVWKHSDTSVGLGNPRKHERCTIKPRCSAHMWHNLTPWTYNNWGRAWTCNFHISDITLVDSDFGTLGILMHISGNWGYDGCFDKIWTP